MREKNTTVYFMERQTDLTQHNNNNRMTLKPEMIFGTCLGIYPSSSRLTRSKFCVPTESSFRTPLKCIGVVRRTNTTLDVLLESRIDYHWNVDGDRELSGP